MAVRRQWLDSAGQVIQFDMEAHMPTNRQLFVNLAVEDLDRSVESFAELGSGSRKVSRTRRQVAW